MRLPTNRSELSVAKVIPRFYTLTNFAEKAPAFRHGDESARQTWHFGKTLLQNDEVSGIIVASLDSPKESGCAGDEKETA